MKNIWLLVIGISILSAIAPFILSDELGCCTNPNSALVACDSLSQHLRDAECCPIPEANFTSYYFSAINSEGPQNYSVCSTEFYAGLTNCVNVSKCTASGCCCGPGQNNVQFQYQCNSTQEMFFSGTTNCNVTCAIPECRDLADNDGNGCADYTDADSGCTNADDVTEFGGICPSNVSLSCTSPSYVPVLFNLAITPEKGEKHFILSWDDECSGNFYEIYRCEGAGCQNLILVGATPSRAFIDSDAGLKWDIEYTYEIKVFYSTGPRATPTIKNSGILGNIECWNQKGSNKFCIHQSYYSQYIDYITQNNIDINSFSSKFNKAYYCSSSNILTQEGTSCASDKVCVVSGNTPQCISKGQCNQNTFNPFGLYSEKAACETNNYCFYDRSYTTPNACYNCDPGMSCYDYKSESGCNTNNCQVGSCTWKYIDYEIGTGVCMDNSLNNCPWCDKAGTTGVESFRAFNNVYEQCTVLKSGLLSTPSFNCIYSKGKAKICDEVVCTDYTNLGLCSSSVTLNANNQIQGASNDPCGIGVCQWYGALGTCAKNADDNGNLDCNNEQCEKDFFAPNTTILPRIVSGIYRNLFIQIFDKINKKDLPVGKVGQGYKTYICSNIVTGPICGSTGHPFSISTNSSNLVITNLKVFDSLTASLLLTLADGFNNVRYYSEDPSKNVEVIKQLIVEAHPNTTGPVVFNVTLDGGNFINGVLYTNRARPKFIVQFYEAALATFGAIRERNGNFHPTSFNSITPLTVVNFTSADNLSDGNYSFEFNAKNPSNNIFMDAIYLVPFAVDRSIGSVSIIPANSTTFNISTVPTRLTFSKTAKIESILISGVEYKSRFGTGYGNIFNATLNLSDGSKLIQVTASDFAGNTIRGDGLFIVNANLNISIVEPRYGVASSYTFNLSFLTDNDEVCRYSYDNDLAYNFMDSFPLSSGTLHRVPNFNRIPTGDISAHTVYVKCLDPLRGIHGGAFPIRVDTTPPILRSLYAFPDPVVEDPPNTTLNVNADEDVICKYSNTSQSYASMTDAFDDYYVPRFSTVSKRTMTAPGQGGFTYYVACENLAGLISTTGQISFSVNLSFPLIITDRTLPYSNSSLVYLAIETNKQAQCLYSQTDTTVNSGEVFGSPGYSHTKSLTLSPGMYTYYAKCRDQILDVWSPVTIIRFTIDVTAPDMSYVNDSSTLPDNPDFTWMTDRLRVRFLATDNQTGNQGLTYFYTLEKFFGNEVIVDWTATNKQDEWIWVMQRTGNNTNSTNATSASGSLNLEDGSKYFFRVRSQNVVGLFSDIMGSDGITIDTTLFPANCTNGVKDEIEADVDCGASCTLCESGKNCIENSDCLSGFCDENKKCADTQCDDSVQNGDESDTDCGGSCDEKCENEQRCIDNGDCESNFCRFGLCKAPDGCADGKLSASETDIDCGGACPTKCQEDMNCDTDDDCDIGMKCVNSKCKTCAENDEDCDGAADIIDTDGDGMPDDWEITHGLDPNDPSDAPRDADSDELTNLEEYKRDTDPNNPDTDSDKYRDGKEVDKGTDPLDPNSYPRSNAFAILLIVIGILLVLAGSGYLIYEYFIQRKARITIKQEIPRPIIMSRPMQRPIRPIFARPSMQPRKPFAEIKPTEKPKAFETKPEDVFARLESMVKKKTTVTELKKLTKIKAEMSADEIKKLHEFIITEPKEADIFKRLRQVTLEQERKTGKKYRARHHEQKKPEVKPGTKKASAKKTSNAPKAKPKGKKK